MEATLRAEENYSWDRILLPCSSMVFSCNEYFCFICLRQKGRLGKIRQNIVHREIKKFSALVLNWSSCLHRWIEIFEPISGRVTPNLVVIKYMVIAHTLVYVSKISRFSGKIFLRLVKIQTGNIRFVVCAEDSIVLNLFLSTRQRQIYHQSGMCRISQGCQSSKLKTMIL